MVPCGPAANGVYYANVFAAVRIVARGRSMGDEAAFVRVGAELEFDAQFRCPVCADLVPEHLATERIDAADGVAAGWVLASSGIINGWVSGLRAFSIL